MLDSDLAMLYQVETKYLNRAVKRNIDRFPEDFCFQLSAEEFENLKCQIGTSSLDEGNGYGGRKEIKIRAEKSRFFGYASFLVFINQISSIRCGFLIDESV